MFSSWSSVATQLDVLELIALYIHCYGHVAIQDAWEGIKINIPTELLSNLTAKNSKNLTCVCVYVCVCVCGWVGVCVTDFIFTYIPTSNSNQSTKLK